MLFPLFHISRLKHGTKDSYFYAREMYYYSICSNYNYVERLLKNNLPEKKHIHTDIPIVFNKDLIFGMGQGEIKHKAKRPYFKYENSEIEDYKVYFYRNRIGPYKAKIEIHFYKNSFFLGLYVFKENPSETQKIINEIKSKYNINLLNDEIENVQIIDNHSNIIDVEYRVESCVIAYINTKNKHLQQLSNKVSLKKKECESRKRHYEEIFAEYL